MGISPEQFVQGLHRRGLRISLETEEPEPRFRLTGPKEKIKESYREYIRRNRAAICVLFGQCRCSECWCLIDEHDPNENDSVWHLTEQGDLYCIKCWREMITAMNTNIDPNQESKNAFRSTVEAIATAIPGCSVRYVPQGMSTEEYIAQFYAEQGAGDQVKPRITNEVIEQEARAIAANDRLPQAQARYWASLRLHLSERGYYEHFARSQAEALERVTNYYRMWRGGPAVTIAEDRKPDETENEDTCKEA